MSNAPKSPNHINYVTNYEVVQIMPSSGVQAAYRQDDGSFELEPIVALAVCLVHEDTYSADGKLLQRNDGGKQVCGIAAGDTFHVCEGISNHVGYLAPGQQIPESWKGA